MNINNTSNGVTFPFAKFFMSKEEKAQQEINQAFDEDIKQVSVEYLQGIISDTGFSLDKGNPTQLLLFIDAINNLMQLKLTGCHTVTLYNQRLELHFDKKSKLEGIYLK